MEVRSLKVLLISNQGGIRMLDMFSLKDKVVIITGGKGFLGSQYCQALSVAGATVVSWDIKDGIDISNQELLKSELLKIKREFGRVDGLINNAAYVTPMGSSEGWSAYEDFPIDLWNNELNVNLTLQMVVTQVVSSVMMKQRSGSIVFVASDLAVIGPNNSIYQEGRFKDIAYISSKAGVLGLMRSWASYLGRYNVRVNALVPGGMINGHDSGFASKNGNLNMLGRMSKKGEYNGAVIFLVSDASSYMTGACLVVDGGRTAW